MASSGFFPRATARASAARLAVVVPPGDAHQIAARDAELGQEPGLDDEEALLALGQQLHVGEGQLGVELLQGFDALDDAARRIDRDLGDHRPLRRRVQARREAADGAGQRSVDRRRGTEPRAVRRHLGLAGAPVSITSTVPMMSGAPTWRTSMCA